MFEQIKREKMNQVSRKIQVAKFETEMLQRVRSENMQMQTKLNEERVELETRIDCLQDEMEMLAITNQRLENGCQDFEIQTEVLTTIGTITTRKNIRKQSEPKKTPAKPLVRAVSATRIRDTTINPRYPCTEFYRYFGSDTKLCLRINNKCPPIGGQVDILRKRIISDVAIGPLQKLEFKSFHEWTIDYASSLKENNRVSNAYNCIWFQDKRTNEWVSLLKTAVVGNIINSISLLNE